MCCIFGSNSWLFRYNSIGQEKSSLSWIVCDSLTIIVLKLILFIYFFQSLVFSSHCNAVSGFTDQVVYQRRSATSSLRCCLLTELPSFLCVASPRVSATGGKKWNTFYCKKWATTQGTVCKLFRFWKPNQSCKKKSAWRGYLL